MSILNPKPRSEAQIAASRANGAKSKGPLSARRTCPIKGLSSHQALAKVIVHPCESEKAFLGLVRMLEESMKPEHPIQHLIVGRIAAAQWRQMRYWKQERAYVADQYEPCPDQAEQGPAFPADLAPDTEIQLQLELAPEPCGATTTDDATTEQLCDEPEPCPGAGPRHEIASEPNNLLKILAFPRQTKHGETCGSPDR